LEPPIPWANDPSDATCEHVVQTTQNNIASAFLSQNKHSNIPNYGIRSTKEHLLKFLGQEENFITDFREISCAFLF
jgi:hypothetical protein